MTDKNRSLIALGAFIILCIMTGMLSSIFTTEGLIKWYPSLVKSPFNPPNGIFAPVWSVLYILMGVSVWLAWRNRENKDFISAFVIFIVQLIFNFLWTFCFFYLQSPLLSLIDIVLLDVSLGLMVWFFARLSKTAAFLLFPYAVWLLFATYLNAYIVYANF